MKQRVNIFLVILTGVYLTSCGEPDAIGPSISIISPTPNAIVTGTVNIICMASDPSGVDHLELWVNGNNTNQTDSQEPYELLWFTDTLDQSNDYVIVVRALDREGNISDSSPLTLDVFHSDIVGDWMLTNLSVEIITRAAEAGTYPASHARGDTVSWVQPTEVSQFWNVSGSVYIYGDKTFEFSGNWLTIDHDSIPSPVSVYSFNDFGTWNSTPTNQSSVSIYNSHLSDELDLLEYGSSSDIINMQYFATTVDHNTWARCFFTWFFTDCDDDFEIMVFDTIRFDASFSRMQDSTLIRSNKYIPHAGFEGSQLPNKGTVVKVK
ncbi:MAG: Ig-like domain-containing protein [Candidatus Marinimicrobia bacterium]|nr:Ig-like domain-containing protein [Candidatus Neomarinimicrobiota bacterium]